MHSRWLWIVLCLFFLQFSLWPMAYEISQKSTLRPERYFELVHNFPTDFNFYLSRIREGIEGAPAVVEKYTSEPHTGSYIHILYLALGWIGGFVRVPWHLASDVYHVARTVFGFTLLVMFAHFARKSFALPRWQIIAFVLAVSASSWPKFQIMEDGSLRLGGYMAWWSVMDSLQRITFIPHLILGQALMIFLIVAWCDDQTRLRWGNWIFLGILGFVLGIIFPPGLIVVWCVYGFYALLKVIRPISSKTIQLIALVKYVAPLASTVLIAFPAMLYLSLMTSFYPWKRLAELDVIKPLPFKYYEYFTAVGPIFPLGVLGLLLAVKNRKLSMYPAVAWVLAWGFLLGVFNFIPQQSPLRFSEMIPHLPLGLLSAYLCLEIYSFLTRRILQEKANLTIFRTIKASSFMARFIVTVIPTMLRPILTAYKRVDQDTKPALFVLYGFSTFLVAYIGLNLYYMHSSWLWQKDFVDHKIRATYPLVPQGSYVMYPLKDFIAAIISIQDSTKRDEIVLAQVNTGNYIPVYGGNKVYIGHDNTVGLETKKLWVKAFYSGTMKQEEAKEFLKTERISRIFYGPLEKEDGGYGDLITLYPFLEKVYENNYIIVYKPKF